MGKIVIPGFRKIEVSGSGQGGTTNYEDLTHKPSINNVPLVGNLNTANLKLTDATLTEEGVPAEAKTVGTKLEEQATSLTALSEQLGNHTVKSDVPENAVFTDTVYDDTEVKESIEELNSNLDALEYSEIAGGKNLINPSQFVGNGSGATYVRNKDGSVTLSNNGTYAGVIIGSESNPIYLEAGTYTLSMKVTEDSGTIPYKYWNIYINKNILSSSEYKNGQFMHKTFTLTEKSALRVVIYNSGNTAPSGISKMTVYAQLENNSVMTPYEPYIPSVKMLEEENEQQNTEAIDLKMLGWTVPKECPVQNEVNGNQFVQKVGRVDLGSLDWTKYDVTQGTLFRASLLSNMKSYGNNDVANAYVNGYTTSASNKRAEKTLSMTANGIDLINSSYTDADTFKQAVQGQYLYYELATYNTMTIDGNEVTEHINESLYALSNGTLTNITNGYYYNNGVVDADSNSSYGIINNLQSGNELCWENANTLTSSSPILIDFFNGDTYISQSNVTESSGSITIPSNVTRAILSMPTTSINTIKVTSGVIANIKNDLCRIEGIGTTEQIVGTFLGKNLYRNTVVLNFSTPFAVVSGNNDTCINSSTGMESQASSCEGNIQWNDIDTLVNAESFAETSSYKYTNPFILTKDKTGYWYCHNVYGTTISATKIVLTLYYTKYN